MLKKFRKLSSLVHTHYGFKFYVPEQEWEAGSRSYYALTKIMKSLKIYRTIIRPIVVCGCKRWAMSEHMEEALRVWEGKILRKV
jgi:hypothetical protein